MVISKADFKRIRGAMPVLDDYFNDIDRSKYSQTLLNLEKMNTETCDVFDLNIEAKDSEKTPSDHRE